MHSKVVLSVSLALTAVGTALIKMTESVTWLGAFFHSISARTAGFSTYSIGGFSKSGLFLLMILMFIRSEERRVGKECRSRWSPYH